MAPEQEPQKRVGRKLTKRRKPIRASSVQYPERLMEGEDAQDDVTAAKGKPAQYMNQSVFSMIAAAGSKTDFHARFEGEGSDSSSEDDQETSNLLLSVEEHITGTPPEERLEKDHESFNARAKSGRQQSKSAERRGFRPLPKLKLRTAKEKNYMSQSVLLPLKETLSSEARRGGVTPRDAPLMSKILEAQAELTPAAHSPEMEEGVSGSVQGVDSGGSPVSLAVRLMEIFGFERPEDVISGTSNHHKGSIYWTSDRALEYPCWLLQSVLLQGYLYITQRHICFFGYLPKKSVSL